MKNHFPPTKVYDIMLSIMLVTTLFFQILKFCISRTPFSIIMIIIIRMLLIIENNIMLEHLFCSYKLF